MDIGSMSAIYGMPIYENELATSSAQVKKHRKKRINKKWLKKYGTKQVPAIISLGNRFLVHPDLMITLFKNFDN